jgi:hypothetical protein
VSRVGHVFVNTPSLEIIAKRISSFSGPTVRRPDGVLIASAMSVTVMTNHGVSVDARRYASVVLVREGKSEPEIADNTMTVFRLLCDEGDVAVMATMDLDATLATFEPGVRPQPP